MQLNTACSSKQLSIPGKQDGQLREGLPGRSHISPKQKLSARYGSQRLSQGTHHSREVGGQPRRAQAPLRSGGSRLPWAGTGRWGTAGHSSAQHIPSRWPASTLAAWAKVSAGPGGQRLCITSAGPGRRKGRGAGNGCNGSPLVSSGSAAPGPVPEGVIRLYSMRFCPFAQRTRLVLRAKGIR